MKSYKIKFQGRKNLAIGQHCFFEVTVNAEDEASARMSLYENYEHIRVTDLKEVTL